MFIVCGVVALALAGCGGESAQAPAETGASSEARDESSGFALGVSVDRTEVRTVDRVAVTIEVTRPAGLVLETTEPDWAAAGWEPVGRVDSPAQALPDGRIRQRTVITLEPFLDGSYEVPPVVVSAGERTLASGALGVEVRSVLEGADAGNADTLAGPAETLLPRVETRPGVWPVGVGLGVALGALLVVLRLTRTKSRAGQPEPDPVGTLRAVAEGRGGPDTLGAVCRAVGVLNVDVGGPLGELAARCDRARYGPASNEDPRAIAQEALVALSAAGHRQGVRA